MKNPYLNAILASLYIAFVSIFMQTVGPRIAPDSKLFGGMAFISLVTLSVALMGYFFALMPLRMYIDGQKQEAVSLFLKTLGTFAGITALVFILLAIF